MIKCIRICTTSCACPTPAADIRMHLPSPTLPHDPHLSAATNVITGRVSPHDQYHGMFHGNDCEDITILIISICHCNQVLITGRAGVDPSVQTAAWMKLTWHSTHASSILPRWDAKSF